MEFVIDNYILRATEEGKIERYYEYKTKPPIWKEIKGLENNNGYLKIALYLTSKRREFLVHRLVYLAHNQEWNIYDTIKVIDHDDGNPKNNKIGNLRLVTQQQNQFNNHTAKGYSYNKKTKKYQAKITLDGKTIYLKEYDTPEKAREAYLAKKATFHTI